MISSDERSEDERVKIMSILGPKIESLPDRRSLHWLVKNIPTIFWWYWVSLVGVFNLDSDRTRNLRMRVKQLAGMTPIETLESLLKEILNVDELCAPCPSAAVKYQSLLKNLYDCVQNLCRRKVGTLASIIIEGFDDESIWEQLQTRNAPLLKFAQRAQRKLKKRLDGTRTSTQSDYAEMGDLDIQNSESEGSSGGDNDGDGDEEMPGQVGSDEEDSSVFDEGRDDYIDESDGSDEPEGENESEEMDEEARMEAYLDRADELEMERQYRAEKRGGDIEVRCRTVTYRG